MKSAPLQKLEFTCAFLVANKASGVVLPTICYTAHPFFTEESKKTKEFHQVLSEYNLLEWQFQYSKPFFPVYKLSKDGVPPNWTAEGKELTKKAVELWQLHCSRQRRVLENLIFFCDNGHAWKKESENLFVNLGARDQVYLNASIHHHLSTLDNGTNATIKKNYHAKHDAHEFGYDEPRARFVMVRESINFTKDQIISYWNRNLQLGREDVSKLTREDLRKVFKNSSQKWWDWHAQCVQEYDEYGEMSQVQHLGIPFGSAKRRNYEWNGRIAQEPTKRPRNRYQGRAPNEDDNE